MKLTCSDYFQLFKVMLKKTVSGSSLDHLASLLLEPGLLPTTLPLRGERVLTPCFPEQIQVHVDPRQHHIM